MPPEIAPFRNRGGFVVNHSSLHRASNRVLTPEVQVIGYLMSGRFKLERGLGEGIRLVGLRAIAARLNPEAFFSEGTDPLVSLGVFARNTLDRIIEIIEEREGLEYPQAVQRAVEFLESEHVRLLPMNEIPAQLHAELAMSTRGQTGRRVRPSDVRDIDQVGRTILIKKRGAARDLLLARQPRLRSHRVAELQLENESAVEASWPRSGP